MRKSRSGFTIVELLIVIVVIAILAAISIVAYTGIQTRAENTKTISGVAQYVKLLTLYKTLNGDYPTHTGASVACFGTGYTDDVCQTSTDGVTPYGINNASFNSALQTVGSLPAPSTKVFTLSNGANVAGANFQYSTKMIRYHLNGAQAQCEAGGSRFVYGTGIQCRITLE